MAGAMPCQKKEYQCDRFFACAPDCWHGQTVCRAQRSHPAVFPRDHRCRYRRSRLTCHQGSLIRSRPASFSVRSVKCNESPILGVNAILLRLSARTSAVFLSAKVFLPERCTGMALQSEQKETIITQFRTHADDTGSPGSNRSPHRADQRAHRSPARSQTRFPFAPRTTQTRRSATASACVLGEQGRRAVPHDDRTARASQVAWYRLGLTIEGTFRRSHRTWPAAQGSMPWVDFIVHCRCERRVNNERGPRDNPAVIRQGTLCPHGVLEPAQRAR